MIIKGIPTSHVVSTNEKTVTASRRHKDYEVEFINSDRNNDIYHLKVFLRRNNLDNDYKIRVVIISDILAYPALDMSWSFDNDSFKLASKVFYRICDEVDDIKIDFDRSMAPISIIGGKVRESLKIISTSRLEKTHILPLDEASLIKGESDYRFSIYHGHYPQMSKEEKHEHKKFEGNESESELKRKKYSLREKY